MYASTTVELPTPTIDREQKVGRATRVKPDPVSPEVHEAARTAYMKSYGYDVNDTSDGALDVRDSFEREASVDGIVYPWGYTEGMTLETFVVLARTKTALNQEIVGHA